MISGQKYMFGLNLVQSVWVSLLLREIQIVLLPSIDNYHGYVSLDNFV